MSKHSLDYKINAILEEWQEDFDELFNYIEHMLEICVVGNDGRSLIEEFDKKDESEKNTLRMIRLAYILSRMSDSFAGKFAICKSQYKNLWQEMEADFPIE